MGRSGKQLSVAIKLAFMVGKCFDCGGKGHWSKGCPKKGSKEKDKKLDGKKKVD